MHEFQIPEEYVTLVRVLTEDRELKVWFDTLVSLPANRRNSELGRVAIKFRNAGQEGLARVVDSLNDESIYQIIKKVTDEFQR